MTPFDLSSPNALLLYPALVAVKQERDTWRLMALAGLDQLGDALRRVTALEAQLSALRAEFRGTPE